MAENSAIEWTDHTFNPWTGCTKVSPGCDHCYAESWAKRSGTVQWGDAPRRRTTEANWRLPLKWNAQAEREGRRFRVFCASLADVFDNQVPKEWRRDLFQLIAETPNLDWLLLTKRIGNAHQMIGEALVRLADDRGQQPTSLLPGWPWPNVWLGATVVNQEEADRDIPKLLATPARVRFLSMEPLLGPVDLHKYVILQCDRGSIPGPGGVGGVMCPHCMGRALLGCDLLNWVIVGGESGHGARPMHPDWARSLRDQCAAAGVPFLFKQWGEYLPAGADADDPALPDVSESRLFWSDGSKWERQDGQRAGVDLVARVGKKAAGRLLDGVEHNGFPT